MNRIIKALAALFTCLLLTLGPAASARAQDAGPAWSGLSQNQQQLLAPFKDSWDALPADRRARLADNARVWLSLTPEERTNLKGQFKVWQQMPQAQKEEARRGYHLYQELPVERRRQALESWQRLRRPTPLGPRWRRGRSCTSPPPPAREGAVMSPGGPRPWASRGRIAPWPGRSG